MKRKLYFAAALDTPMRREVNAAFADALSQREKFDVYLPQRDGGMFFDLRLIHGAHRAAEMVYEADIKALRASDLVVARLSSDPGVTFEIGYAAALGKDVIGIVQARPEQRDLNPMIWQGCKAVYLEFEFWRWVALQ